MQTVRPLPIDFSLGVFRRDGFNQGLGSQAQTVFIRPVQYFGQRSLESAKNLDLGIGFDVFLNQLSFDLNSVRGQIFTEQCAKQPGGIFNRHIEAGTLIQRAFDNQRIGQLASIATALSPLEISLIWFLIVT